MKRASLIVVVLNECKHAPFVDAADEQQHKFHCEAQETGYTCESVQVNIDGTVTFFCSGTPQTVHQDRIVRIDYAPRGAMFCPHCDQSIEHVFYGDQRHDS